MKATRSAAPVTSLLQLQSWLFERVTRAAPDRDSEARAPDTELGQRVVSGSLSAAARVEVYRHGYFARLVECLEDDYPALAQALGARCFQALCGDFILLHPPVSASLNYYGAPFAAYCGQRRESWSAFAADLARLEWAVVEAIHADEGERLDVEALGRLSPEQWSTARLVASPALRLLFPTYPVEEFYRAWKEGSAVPLATDPNDSDPNDSDPNDSDPNDSDPLATDPNDSDPNDSDPLATDPNDSDPNERELPAPAASAVVVCRRGEDVWRIRLCVPLGRLLESLIAGAPLLEALERLGSDAPTSDQAWDNAAATNDAATTPEELQQAFRDWVSCGLFSGVAIN